MKPNSMITLCRIPELSPDYANTWKWDSPGSQLKYFQAKGVHNAEKYTYLRKDNAIKVGYHVDDLKGINYLFYQNDRNGGTGKYYFCFIMRKEYVNELTTILYIKTDLLQTYQFDIDVKPSYVDRCHVDRWTRDGQPNMNQTVPEGLEFGDNIQIESKDVYTFKDSYVAVCSNPLGKIAFRKKLAGQGDDGEGDIEDCGDWFNGVISSKGLRFIKGEEGFAPKKYWDKWGKVWTIGYGVTEPSEPDAFRYLESKNPASEEDCAKVSYYLKNERYGKRILPQVKALGISEQYEFDALVSFVYNLGTGVLNPGREIYDIIKKYKQGQATCDDVKNVFVKYNTSGGQVLPGLTKRRQEEGKMFCGEAFTSKPIDIIENGVPTGTFKGDGWLPCEGGSDIPTGSTYEAQGYTWNYPTTGRVTSLYGDRIHPITGAVKRHHGIDIASSQGTPIVAPRSGTVELSAYSGSAGNMVIIHHDDINMKTVYMHCYSLTVKQGDKVKAGQQIATQGTTGTDSQGRPTSTGVHLHFELRVPPFNRTDTVSPIQKPIPVVGDIIK